MAGPESKKVQVTYFSEDLRDVTAEQELFNLMCGGDTVVVDPGVVALLCEQPVHDLSILRPGESIVLTARNMEYLGEEYPGNPPKDATYRPQATLTRIEEGSSRFLMCPDKQDISFVVESLFAAVRENTRVGLRYGDYPLIHDGGFLYGRIVACQSDSDIQEMSHPWTFGPVLHPLTVPFE